MGQTDEACHTLFNTGATVAVDLMLMKLATIGAATGKTALAGVMGWVVVGAFAGEAIATYMVEAPIRDLQYMDGLINDMFSGRPDTLYGYHYPYGRSEDTSDMPTVSYSVTWDKHDPGFTTNYSRNPGAYESIFSNWLNVEWEAQKQAAKGKGEPEPTLRELVGSLLGRGGRMNSRGEGGPIIDRTYDLPVNFLKLIAHMLDKTNMGEKHALRIPWAMLKARESADLARYKAQFEQMRKLINEASAAERKAQGLTAEAVTANVTCPVRTPNLGTGRRNDTPDDNLDVSSGALRSGERTLYDDLVLGILRKPEKLPLLYDLSLFHKAYSEMDDATGLADPDEVFHPENLYLLMKQLELVADQAEGVAASLASQDMGEIEAVTFNVQLDETIIDVDGNEQRLEGSFEMPFYPLSSYVDNPELLRHNVDVQLDYLSELWSVPEVALLRGGEYKPLMDFLLENHVPVALVDSQVTLDELVQFDTLLVPSGAFSGLGTQTFQDILESFTLAGGTIVSFTQQYGFDFEVLPGGDQIDAYGWAEDQACQFRSSSISAYIPAFASQTSATPNFNVDGYFMDWPSDGLVLLRRTANDQPAMVVYNYGLGRVLVSSLYSDWAYSHHQMTADEKLLILDLVNWAKEPTAFGAETDVEPGEQATVLLPISNFTESAISTLTLHLANGDGSIEREWDIPVQIGPGESEEVEVAVAMPSGKPGIYTLDYTAKDVGARSLFNGIDVVSVSASRYKQDPAGFAYKGQDVTFSIQSDREVYPLGANGDFSIIVFNNSSSDRQVRVKWRFPHNSWVAPDTSMYQNENILDVPAGDKATLDLNVNIINGDGIDRLWADFYNADTGATLGRSSKGFYTLRPSLTVNVASDKPQYETGEPMTVIVGVENPQVESQAVSGTLSVFDPTGSRVFRRSLAGSVSAEGVVSLGQTVTQPANAFSGEYQVAVVMDLGGERVGGGATTFAYHAGPGVLSGRVLDLTAGTPVANAEIVLYSGDEVTRVASGPSGSYELELPSGRYKVELSASGYLRTTSRVTVAPGHNPAKDFVAFSVTAAGAGYSRVSGKVLGSISGRPMQGVDLQVVGDFGEIAVPVGVEGQYELSLPPGTYDMAVLRDVEILLEGVPVDLFPGRETVQDLYVPDTVSGTVSGRVLDLISETPIAGANILTLEQTVETGPDGVYTLDSAASGFQQMTVEAQGYETREVGLYATARGIEGYDLYLTPSAAVPIEIDVQDLQTDSGLPGAEAAVANAVLSGSDSPTGAISMDNRRT